MYFKGLALIFDLKQVQAALQLEEHFWLTIYCLLPSCFEAVIIQRQLAPPTVYNTYCASYTTSTHLLPQTLIQVVIIV